MDIIFKVNKITKNVLTWFFSHYNERGRTKILGKQNTIPMSVILIVFVWCYINIFIVL